MDFRDNIASSGGPPLSVQEIAARAVDFEYNPTIPLRYWLRSADTILKEASIYEREGNEQQTYMLVLRHAELVLRHILEHPEAKSPEYGRHLRVIRQQFNQDVKRLEYLKPRIYARHAAYENAQREKEALRQALGTTTRSPPPPGTSTQYSAYPYDRTSSLTSTSSRQSPHPMDLSRSRHGTDSPGPLSPPLDGNPTPPNTQEVAIELARQEFARRAKEKLARSGTTSSTRSSKWSDWEVERIAAPPTPVPEISRDRHAPSRQQYTPYRDGERRERDRRSGEYDLQKQMQTLNMRASELHSDLDWKDSRHSERERSKRDSGGTGKRDSGGSGVGGGGSIGRSSVYNYPTVPKRSTATPPAPAPLPQFPASLTSGNTSNYSIADSRVPPPLPPLPNARSPPPLPPLPDSMRNGHPSTAPPAPPVPRKAPLPPPSPPLFPPNSLPSLPNLPVTLTNPTPPPPPKSAADPQPLKRSATTSNYEFKTSARLENGQRLRTIFLPSNLRHKFLEIAHPNTRRNLETCGVLCGTLIQNALFITRLVIPEQEVTSDTCDMKDEEELFKYVDGEDLMVLGWIHTHPMYECFMSSVDLHNHCGYQLMLPESIAVVCAPRYEPSWGVFRLTDPPGVKTIMTCTQKNLFHPHEGGGELYTDAMRPGHVVVVNEMEFEVIDLRKSR